MSNLGRIPFASIRDGATRRALSEVQKILAKIERMLQGTLMTDAFGRSVIRGPVQIRNRIRPPDVQGALGVLGELAASGNRVFLRTADQQQADASWIPLDNPTTDDDASHLLFYMQATEPTNPEVPAFWWQPLPPNGWVIHCNEVGPAQVWHWEPKWRSRD